MTTFKRLMPNISNHKIVSAELTSVISTLLLLGGPSLLANIQNSKVFWSHGTIRNSHSADFILLFYYSPMGMEWAEEVQRDRSLYVKKSRILVLCHVSAATLALVLGNQGVKPSITSTSLPAGVKIKCLSSHLNTPETIRLLLPCLEV